MTIQTAPIRLSQMLVDADDAVVGAYYYTQEAIDLLDRPCWLIFVEDAAYPQTTQGQEQVEQSYSLAFVGAPFNAGYSNFNEEYEALTRRIADNTIKYLLEHPQMQVSNRRGLFDEAMGGLDTVLWAKINNRSGITLFTRDAVGEAFWGFTIDITLTEMLDYEAVGL